jgi:putative endonuclease
MPTARSELGARGEGLARAFLKAKGYQVVATNYRCPSGEMDIIARDGPCLVFVEVRTRRSRGGFGAPQESISRGKRERLIAVAETYIQGCEGAPEDWRIDLVAINIDSRGVVRPVEHIESAVERE